MISGDVRAPFTVSELSNNRKSVAAALPATDPARKALMQAAEAHARAALEHVASGQYMGEHWLASFAVYMLSVAKAP